MPSPNECSLGAVDVERERLRIRLRFASLRDSYLIALVRLGRHVMARLYSFSRACNHFAQLCLPC